MLEDIRFLKSGNDEVQYRSSNNNLAIISKEVFEAAQSEEGGISMLETMIATLIGSGVTLITTMVTLFINSLIEKHKCQLEIQQKKYELKREKLNDIYEKLVDIVNQYPNSSPNDVLQYVEYAPNYSMELFDAVLKSLDYQIEDCKKQLSNVNISYKRKSDVDTQVSNSEYAKKKISEIRDEYYMARDRYKSFCKSDKAVFDLYAGQDVRNCLVEFEVLIHNVFISGHSVGDVDNPLNNRIEIIRREIINSMRNDLGTY